MAPVRTIHHLSCSGGTLISKCVAVCSNPLFLSEINPVYAQPKLSFAPLDLLSQLHIQYKALTPQDKEAYFRAQMEILNNISDRQNRPICIRDHTHSSFMRRNPASSSEMREMLYRAGYPILSIATIRHPLDAFAAMLKRDWAASMDNSLDTYCARVLTFKAYCDAKRIPIWRYETFCLDPTSVMKDICAALKLTFNENFLEDFGTVRLTGDSGRSSPKIELRERRPISPDLVKEAKRSEAFAAVCKAFGYHPDPHAHPLDGASDIPLRPTFEASTLEQEQNPAPVLPSAAKTMIGLNRRVSSYLDWIFEAITRNQIRTAGTHPDPDELVEIAHGKPFRLESAYPGYPLEGRVGQQAPFFFHTSVENPTPAITVDLQGKATLYRAIIANRTDQLPERGANLVLIAHGTPDPKTGTGFPFRPDAAFLTGETLETELSLPGVVARYVTIVSPLQTALHFSDLRLYGEIVA